MLAPFLPASVCWSGISSASTGPDGHIYLIGTGNCNSYSSPVEAYDPTTDTWTAVAPLSTTIAISGLATATGPDGRIYAIGGTNGSGGAAMTTVEAYSTTTQTWQTVAPLNTARANLAAAVGPDGRIYAIGGSNSSGVLNSVEAYDTTMNTWTTVGSLNIARQYLAAATGPDGRIYAIGGSDNNNTIRNSVEAYDIAAGMWTNVAPMAAARAGLAAVTGPDGRIYALGGNATGTAEAYLPPPAVTGIAPASGPGAGGTLVMISGWGFNTGPRATSVSFGGTAARLVRASRVDGHVQIDPRGNSFTGCMSTLLCYAISPAGTAGTAIDVTVTTAGGSSAATNADQFSYLAACGPTGLSTSPAAQAPAGSSVGLTATDAGCGSVAGTRYQFWGLAAGGSWTVLQSYSAATAYYWVLPASAPVGPYLLAVWVQAAGSPNAYDSYAMIPYTVLGPVPCTSATLAVSPAGSVQAGEGVTLTASAAGCPSPQFQFWVEPVGGTWNIVQSYSASASYAWATSGQPVGNYNLAVWARNAGSSTAYEAYALSSESLTTTPCSSVTLSASPAGNQTAGHAVTLSASASGCPLPTYEFWVLPPGGTWIPLPPGYQGGSSFTWQSQATPGSYLLAVWVRDEGSGNAYEAYAVINYSLN